MNYTVNGTQKRTDIGGFYVVGLVGHAPAAYVATEMDAHLFAGAAELLAVCKALRDEVIAVHVPSLGMMDLLSEAIENAEPTLAALAESDTLRDLDRAAGADAVMLGDDGLFQFAAAQARRQARFTKTGGR